MSRAPWPPALMSFLWDGYAPWARASAGAVVGPVHGTISRAGIGIDWQRGAEA